MSDLTRQEAADLLDNLIGMVDDNQGNRYDDALKLAIHVLKADGDLISRQSAVDALKYCELGMEVDTIKNLPSIEAVPVVQDADGTLHITVKDQLAVNRVMVEEEESKFCGLYYQDAVQVIHGRWDVRHDDIFADRHFCSCCGDYANADLYGEEILSAYCPNCGASMTEGGEDD